MGKEGIRTVVFPKSIVTIRPYVFLQIHSLRSAVFRDISAEQKNSQALDAKAMRSQSPLRTLEDGVFQNCRCL